MKIFIRFILAVIALFQLVSCIKDDDYNIPHFDCVETLLTKTIEVDEIPASTTVTQFTADEIIEAYVTSSDEGGNFFKTISFQTLEGNAAFSIPIDANTTFINFEPGRKVLIKMKNLYTDISDGNIRFGSIYLDGGIAEVGRLPEDLYPNILIRSCIVIPEDELVKHVTMTQLMNNSYLNKLVELDNVQFSEMAVGKYFYDQDNDIGGATNHYLEDALGGLLVFRTSSFSNFAYQKVPAKSGKIRGVLTRFGDTFQLLARTQMDIKLDEERFIINPVFLEDFNTATDGSNLNIPNWLNFAQAGTKLWKEETFVENGYAEFSGYGSGNALNIAWLISPAINFGDLQSKIIRFKIAQHHLDVDSGENSLEVLISNNFDGTNVLAATWTLLEANIPTTSDEPYEWLDSVIDITAFETEVHLAFKFIGSGTNTTLDGAFDIDEVKAYGQ